MSITLLILVVNSDWISVKGLIMKSTATMNNTNLFPQSFKAGSFCFRHVDTGQFWLIRFDSLGNIESSCHIDRFSDFRNLIFITEYNGLLEAESEELEYVPNGFSQDIQS